MKFRVRTLATQALVFSLLAIITAAAKQTKSKQCPQTLRRKRVTNLELPESKKVIDHVLSKIVNKIDMIYIVSDSCASQFRSKFVFKLFTLIHPKIGLEWHCHEAHHGKESMDGIGGTVKNTVFRKVLSGEVVIGSPEEFAQYANQIC